MVLYKDQFQKNQDFPSTFLFSFPPNENDIIASYGIKPFLQLGLCLLMNFSSVREKIGTVL